MMESEFIVECTKRALQNGIPEPAILRRDLKEEYLEVCVGNSEHHLLFTLNVSTGQIEERLTKQVVTVKSEGSWSDVMLGPADWRLIEAVVKGDRLAAIKEHKSIFGSGTGAARAEVDSWIAECEATGAEVFAEKLGALLESKNLRIVGGSP